MVPESSPSRSSAIGFRVERPRPTKRALSVSQLTGPAAGEPSTTCTHQSSRSFDERGRRVAVMAVHQS